LLCGYLVSYQLLSIGQDETVAFAPIIAYKINNFIFT